MKKKDYIIRGSYDVDGCIARVSYNGKYIIVKCKEMFRSLKNIENAVNAFMRGGLNKPEGLYYHLLNYVKENPGHKFSAKAILVTDNAYELLKREQEELDAGRSNPDFLNNQVEAYIPQYNEDSGHYGWIDRGAVLNFRKWQKARKRARKANTAASRQ